MNTAITCFTALINIAEEEQCEELEEYLRSKGSDIVTSSDTELLLRLQAIIQKCSVVFEQKDQQDLEGFFYSVVSLFHVVSSDQVKDVVDSFCVKIVEGGTPENLECRLKLLGLMFCHFPAKDPLRYTILCHRIKLAGQTGLSSSLAVDMDQLCKWVELWKIDMKEKRNLFELLWQTFKNERKKTLPIRILKELLLTYSDADASEGKSYAEELIKLVILDPSSFIFDDILELPPIKALADQNIHNLLKIFVFDYLSSFETFYSQHKAFVDELGIDHESCVAKMRHLTLSSMAVSQEVIPFSSLREELQLSQEELEDFIINCIRLKLVEARINQVNQTLVIMSSIHRTFEKGQWQLLHDRLSFWQQGLQNLKSSLKTVKA